MSDAAPKWLPVGCEDCRHLNRDAPLTCAAFPAGIPARIRGRANSHLSPVEGDGGVRFEPTPELLEELRSAGVLQPPPTRAAA